MKSVVLMGAFALLCLQGNAVAVPLVSTVAYQINSGGTFVSPYVADTYYSGGTTYSTGSGITTSGVTDPAPQAVYQTERYGDFSYVFSGLAPNANYVVRLHFAELYHNSANSRLFNVLINGAQVLTGFDIYAAAGGKNRALVRQFTTTADENGLVTVHYVNVVDNAKSSGIELFNAPTAPFMLSQPGDQTTVEGGIVSFSVEAGGYPDPLLQWRKDGADLIGETNTLLTIENVQAGDEGVYSVHATNSVGSVVSSNALLTIAAPASPSVSVQPADQTLTIGLTAVFNPVVAGNPEPVFQWQKDGIDIPGATSQTLVLENVQSSDHGEYTLVASNAYGSVVSSNAALTVEGPDGYCMVNGTTTGGSGGPVVTVDNGDDFIAQVGMAGPRVILVDGVVSVGTANVAADKTIVGLGTNATVFGKLNIVNTTNVIVRNLRVTGPIDDAIAVWNSQHVWIDHCSLYDSADGLCDINRGSQYVTVSWCRFYYDQQPQHRFTMLVQGTSDENSVTLIMGYFTLHHNWWGRLCDQRMAMSYDCRIHYYNNYFDCSGNYYATGAGNEAEINSENNYYLGVRSPIGIRAGSTGKIRTSGNLYPGCYDNIHPGTDSVFTPPYTYSLDATVDVPSIVQAGAGAAGPDMVSVPYKIWDGGGVDNYWNTGANWSAGEAPKQADRIVFEGSSRLNSVNNFPASTEFYGIGFGPAAGAFTLGGNTFNVGETITDDSAEVQTINADMDFAFAQDRYPSNRYVNVSDPAGSLVINGDIAGASNGYFSAYCITKQGPGLLTLNGDNTFDGSLQLDGGLLQFNALNSLGNGDSIKINGGGLRWASGNTADISSRTVKIQTGGAVLDSGANDITFASPIGNSGSGGLIKTGSGTITLNGSNAYSGSTLIEQGTLALGTSGAIPNSPQIILTNNAVLDVSGRSDATLLLGSEKSLVGQGAVDGNFSVGSGASVSPGFPLGSLSINGAIDLQPGSTVTMELNTSSAGTNDLVGGASSITYGGNLVVANLGPALVTGDTFKLFDAVSYSGSFDSISLPDLNEDLVWANTLAIDGSLSVVSSIPPVNTTPTNMVFSMSGSNMTFSWPADHTGWTLEANTNSLLSPVWFPVPDSVLTNEITIQFYPGATNAFFRLRYP